MANPYPYIGETNVGESVIGFSKTTPEGTVGFASDLPFNDFPHTGGNRVGVFFEMPEDGYIYEVQFRVRSDTDTNNEGLLAIYDKVGLDAAANIEVSPDAPAFSTSLTTLTFSFDYIPVSFLQQKWFVFQAKSQHFFVYDNISVPGYGFFGNSGYGNWDSSPTGIGIFNNTLTVLVKYTTTAPSGATIKKTLMLTGVGH